MKEKEVSFTKDEMYEIEKTIDQKASALSCMLFDVIKNLILIEDRKGNPTWHKLLLERLNWLKESLNLVDSIRIKCEQQRSKKARKVRE